MGNGSLAVTFHDRYDKLVDLVYNNSDLRTRDMLFMKRLDLVVITLVLYWILCLAGPVLMMKYKPFNLKWAMFAYNALIAIWSLQMFYKFLVNSRRASYNYVCDAYTLSYDQPELEIVNTMWWYFVSKVVEFADTAFMVLKKKNSQITFLHVWHHTFMFPFLFFATLFGPCCQAVIGPIMNTFVHVVMYSYYALSLFPSLHPYLWWKKYLTQLQLVQFVILFTLTANGLATDCKYPRLMGWLQFGFMISLIFLFANFYIQAYIRRLKNPHAKGPGKIMEKNLIEEKKEL